MSIGMCSTASASSSSLEHGQQQNERTRLLESQRSGGMRCEDTMATTATTAGDAAAVANAARTLGTFEGVFAPVCLSMLSSILFLRVGYIVGNVGFLYTILQLGMAYSILVFTVLSICAIATNGAVEGGGVYFMLSRTLGIEFGTAIGALFWCGNVVSSGLYLTACAEGLVGSFGPTGSLGEFLPAGWEWTFLYCSILNSTNLLICVYGAKLFGKASTAILVAVFTCTLLTVFSFFRDFEYHATYVYNATSDCLPPVDNSSNPNCTKVVNGSFIGLFAASTEVVADTFVSNLYAKAGFDCSKETAAVDFAKVFGVLFSGVTGIMSGANVSGELVSPSKSIPRGTLSACLCTLSVLFVLALLTALTCSSELLLHDCMYLSEFSYWSGIVTFGILFATYSASLNNLIGATRVMEAVLKDLRICDGMAHRPFYCIVVTWLLIEVVLIMGALNKIAVLSSVLFLLSYASINLACLVLDFAAAPNFRPSFKYFWMLTTSCGLAGCTIMMFVVSVPYSAGGLSACLAFVVLLCLILPRGRDNWGSIIQAILFHQVRKYLLMLDPRKAHVKYWRPQVLLLVSNPRTSCSLIDFVNAVKKGGLFVLGHVYNERLSDLEKDPCVTHQNHWLSLIDHLRVKAFVELTLSTSLREGIGHLVRISGLGAMKCNTIIMGFLDGTFHGDDFVAPSSPFATDAFENAFSATRSAEEQEQSAAAGAGAAKQWISKREYVGTMCDLIKMEKNVCLSRHFQQLNKDSLFGPNRQSIFGTRARKKLFLDAWLIDFFSSDVTPISDATCHLVLQLACIVNSCPRWKKLGLRVFIADNTEGGDGRQLLLLQQTLELLRIRAEPQVLEWVLPPRLSSLSLDDEPGPSSHRPTRTRVSDEYLDSAAQMIRGKSVDTAVSFLYLPSPPGEEDEHEVYLDRLTALTEQWPPTMFVRGVSTVTTTAL